MPSCRIQVPSEPIRRDQISGSAVVEFLLDRVGRIDPLSVRVVSATHYELGPYAVAMARSCGFVAARVEDIPVPSRARLMIVVNARRYNIEVSVRAES